MPVVMTITAPSREDYERIVEIVGEGPPTGCIVHTASEVEGGVRVVDVWESQRHLDDFFQTKLGPAFAEIGMQPEPPQLSETFRIERS